MLFDIEKDSISSLPVLKYEGEIVFIEKSKDVRSCTDEILEEEIIGIDTETKPAFKKGVYHPVALLQIATSDKVFLFRLNMLTDFKDLKPIFEAEELLKIGIGLRDDIRELKQLIKFEPEGFIDLNEEAPKIGFKKIGMRNLSAMILDSRISKRQQVSDWEKHTLSKAQIDYAATDAWVSRLLFMKLLEEGKI
ncbi:MAG: 3'-5' exonuclease [Bacteroidota bacterium]